MGASKAVLAKLVGKDFFVWLLCNRKWLIVVYCEQALELL